MIICIGVIIPTLLFNNPFLSSFLFIFVILLSIIAKISRIFLSNIIKATGVLLCFIIFGYGFFVGEQALFPVFTLEKGLIFGFPSENIYFTLKKDGLNLALIIISRLLAVFGVAYLLTLTTHPGDLIVSLYKSGMPYKISYALLSTFQLVPVIQNKAMTIMDAQRSRGLNLETSLINKIKGIVPLVVPLLMGVIFEAQERAMALESRGFSAKVKKTFIREVTVEQKDKLVIFATFCLCILVCITTFFYPDFWFSLIPFEGLEWLK